MIKIIMMMPNNSNNNGYNNVNHYNHNFFLSLFLPSIRYVNNNYSISTIRDIQRFVITSTIFCNSYITTNLFC